VGIASWVSIVSTPLGGILVDWSGRINSFIWAGTIISTVGIVFLVWGGPIVVWMVLLGVAFGLVPGAVMALPQQVLLPTSRSMGFGLFYTFVFLGFGVLPAVAGWLQDVTGSADMSMYFSGAVTLLTIPALLIFRALQRRLGSPGLEYAQAAAASA
jgi:MFS family permease